MIKKTFTLTLMLMAAVCTMAQAVGYECTYQEKVNIGDQLSQIPDAASRDALEAWLGKRKSFYKLTYANGKSLYEKNQDISDDDFGMGGTVPVFYVDFARQEQIMQINFFGRNFYIVDTLAKYNWTFTTETRDINGWKCTKVESDSNIVAWFTAETPIPAGPLNYYGLPGLVVELSVGPVTYTLTEIKPLAKDPKLKAPTKGKKVTQEELQEIITQKLKEMGFGDGNGFQMMRM